MVNIRIKISGKIASVGTNIAKGIRYGYKKNNGKAPLYHLGEQPISIFINDIYKDIAHCKSKCFIVDLGCGEGRFIKYAPIRRSWRFIGIDFDIDAVTATQQYMRPTDEVIFGDIVNISKFISPEQYNITVAVAHRVLHGLPTNEQYKVFESVAQLLRPSGTFYVTVASAEKDWKAQALKDQGIYKEGQLNECKDIMFTNFGLQREEPFLINFLTEEACLNLIRSAGFKILEQDLIYEQSGYDHLRTTQNAYHAFKLTL